MFSTSCGVFLTVASVLAQVSSRRHRHHNGRDGEVTMNDFIPSGDLMGTVPQETVKEWYGRIQSSDFSITTGLNCRCTAWRGDWTKWTPCSARSGGCYKATQLRLRKCQRDCNRIQIRNCLDVSTCSGTWGPWIFNTTCSDCAANELRKSLRFCKSSSGDIGPYCGASKGEIYQEKEVPCNQSCPEKDIASGPGEGPLSNALPRKAGNPRTTGWIESSKGNLVVILLAVFAGVMLVALIFVSVMFTSMKRRKPNRRGVHRDLRSATESMLSATSYLSGMERDSRASGRTPIYQQHKQGSARRSLMLPRNLSSLSMGGNVSGNISASVQVRCPMQHNDSLMLVRKQMHGKRENKGSIRSINKLLRERSRDEGDGFLVGGFSLSGTEEDGRSHKKKDTSIKRRATDGAYDTYERQKQREYLGEAGSVNMTTGDEEDKKEKSSLGQETDRDSDSSNSSMDSGNGRSKKRLSVDDIRRLFESRSADQSPSRSSPKSTADIPRANKAVGESISRFEQASAKSNGSHDLTRKFFGSLKRKKNNTATSTKDVQSSAQTIPDGKNSEQSISETEKDEKQNLPERHIEKEIQSPLKNRDQDIHANTIKPRKATFLFSPQAYNSLQRSRVAQPVSPNKGGFKMDMDALIKKTVPTQEGARHKSHKKQENEANIKYSGNHRSASGNGIIVPPPRAAISSYDPDTYADVWDAKVMESDAKSTESVYADVWDSSSSSRRSICEDDDGDYSEVYDAANNSVNIAKARRFAKQNNVNMRNRSASQGNKSQGEMSLPRPEGATKRIIFDTKQATTQSSVSCGSSPARSQLPLCRTQRRLSRESSTGSDGSAPQDRLSSNFLSPPAISYDSSTELQTEPLYCVI